MRRLTRIGIATLVAMLGLSGFSYAGTGANPIRAALHLVSHDEDSAPAPDVDVQSTADDDTDTDDADETAHGVERSTTDCPEGFDGNHGQFVSTQDDKQTAAHSKCGKPVHAVNHEPSDEPGEHGHAADDHGKSGDEHGNDDHPSRDDHPNRDNHPGPDDHPGHEDDGS